MNHISHTDLTDLTKTKKTFLYPEAKIVGHRDFPNVHKDCPCLDVQTEYAELNSL